MLRCLIEAEGLPYIHMPDWSQKGFPNVRESNFIKGRFLILEYWLDRKEFWC